MDSESASDQASHFRNQGRREVALWESVVGELVRHGFIKPEGSRGMVYGVTFAGYKIADAVISENGMDLEKPPSEYLED